MVHLGFYSQLIWSLVTQLKWTMVATRLATRRETPPSLLKAEGPQTVHLARCSKKHQAPPPPFAPSNVP